VKYTKQAPGAVAWEATSASGPLEMRLAAQMEFDGNVEYHDRAQAASQVTLRDIRLEIPFARTSRAT